MRRDMLLFTSVVGPESQPSTLPPDVGVCAACGQRNSKRATRCHACRATLPWAEGKVKTNSPKPAAKAATSQPAATAAASAARRNTGSDSSEVDQDLWWESIGVGVFLLAMAGFSYWYFAMKEASGGFFRSKWWIVLLYSLGGKWLVAGILGVLGFAGIVMGLVLYFGRNKR
jgi:hypothetical protein